MLVLEENWEAVGLYLAVQTQWRTAGMAGQRTGLDYNAVDSVMRRKGLGNAVFEQLQVIEREMLSYWNLTL